MSVSCSGFFPDSVFSAEPDDSTVSGFSAVSDGSDFAESSAASSGGFDERIVLPAILSCQAIFLSRRKIRA